MDANAAFEAAIYELPDDDMPRLVYADWLEEHGQPERAELIRLQCRMARGEPHSPEEEDRAFDLVEEYRKTWTAHLLQDDRTTWAFQRGFPEELQLELAVMLEQWHVWAAVPRVRYLTLSNTTDYLLRSFATRSWNPEWSVLRLSEEPKPWLHEQPHDLTSGIRAVALSPQARRVRELYFDCHALSEGGVVALCESPHLEQLLFLGVNARYMEEPRLVKRFGERLRRTSLSY